VRTEVDYYVYYSRTVKRMGPVEFVPVTALSKLHGFRSVYWFKWRDALDITKANKFGGISHIPVHAYELLVDFDNNKQAADRFHDWLLRGDYMFNKYLSGNRSYHFHVMTTKISGVDVPYSQLQWVRANIPGADDSVYRTTGLFRLSGTYHEKKAGQRKTLVSSHGTLRLDIPYVERKLLAMPQGLDTDTARWRYEKGLFATKGQGGRRMYAGYLAMMAFDAGIDVKQATEEILKWNDNYAQPPYEDVQHLTDRVWSVYDDRLRGG
jgi:hypothetical protein